LRSGSYLHQPATQSNISNTKRVSGIPAGAKRIFHVKQIKVRGIVLREYAAGESDKRLVIFCKGVGRLLVYARGARKPTSRFMSAAQLFTYADFVLTKGNGFYSLAQAEIIESFYPLREDYDRLMAAHLVAEVCEKTLLDSIESDDLLRLVLKSLTLLAKGKVSPAQVATVFLLHIPQKFITPKI
jgi:DNA repair protein RecO (recombination protein O)